MLCTHVHGAVTTALDMGWAATFDIARRSNLRLDASARFPIILWLRSRAYYSSFQTLRVILMSATLISEALSAYFDHCPLLGNSAV